MTGVGHIEPGLGVPPAGGRGSLRPSGRGPLRPAGGRGPRPGKGRAGGATSARTTRPLRSDKGTAILEFTGMLPLVLFIGMAAIQLGIAGYTASQAATAARAAARTEAQGRPGGAAGYAALSGWLRDDATVGASPCGNTTRGTVHISVPSIIGVGVGSVTRTVVMPCDDPGGVTR